jgi:hypothetical protein
MEHITVKRPSAKSLAKLKKGMPVRLSAGEGLELIVNPASYNTITRSFAKGRGLNMALSPEEVKETHGKGFFDAVKKGTQKFADKATDRLVEHAVKTGEEHLERALTGKGTKKGQMRKTARRAYEDTPSQYGGALDNDILEKINEYTGQHLGHLAKSSAVQAGARMLRGNMEGAFSKALASAPMLGYGLSAEPSMGGYGLMAEPSGGRMRRREVASVGAGGSLLGMPPALMSQPYSANFQFGSRLPPAYQHQINSGMGLY